MTKRISLICVAAAFVGTGAHITASGKGGAIASADPTSSTSAASKTTLAICELDKQSEEARP